MSTDAIDRIRQFYGSEDRISNWHPVEQAAIQQFADCTHDQNWIHVDAERARRESPFGGPIAHGMFTLSALPFLVADALGELRPSGVQMGVNYGFDKVRMMTPVPVGSRIRNCCKFLDVQHKGGNRYIVKTENRVEIEGIEKPALVAEWLFMLFVDDAA